MWGRMSARALLAVRAGDEEAALPLLSLSASLDDLRLGIVMVRFFHTHLYN